MKPYSSIETLYKRSKETNKLDTDVIRQDVNTMIDIRQWVLTEKVDGTNLRIIYSANGKEIRGRTDRAQFNSKQLSAFDAATPSFEEMSDHFTIDEHRVVTLYGEGFGAGIQKKGHQYRDDIGFALFDVRMTNLLHGSDFYLSHDSVCGVSEQFGIYMVPVLGPITEFPRTREDLLQIIPYSKVAEYFRDVTDVEAEGIVAKPNIEMRDQYGNRIQIKLCFRDL